MFKIRIWEIRKNHIVVVVVVVVVLEAKKEVLDQVLSINNFNTNTISI